MKDKLGIFVSGLCVIHCLIISFLIWGGVGSISILSISEQFIHPILLVFVFIIGLVSFPSAYINHQISGPLIIGLIGTIGLFAALLFSTTLEVILTLFFGSVLIMAHFWNHKLQS